MVRVFSDHDFSGVPDIEKLYEEWRGARAHYKMPLCHDRFLSYRVHYYGVHQREQEVLHAWASRLCNRVGVVLRIVSAYGAQAGANRSAS